MAEVVVFHHAQGLTPGVIAFADELRAAGHKVHAPDLFEGQHLDTIDDGMAYVGRSVSARSSPRRPDGGGSCLWSWCTRASPSVSSGPEPGPDAAGSAGGTAVLLLRAGVGVRLDVA